MTAVATTLVTDGTVRLDTSPSEPTHTLLFHPVNGGGLLLRNPSTGAWDMHLIADTTLDVYNCKIGGVANQRIKRSTLDIAGPMNGPQSAFVDVTVNPVTGLATHIGGSSPAPQWAAAWNARYARGDALGEKLYFEVQVGIWGFTGVGLIAETQAPPLPPFNGAATFGPGTTCFVWYNNGTIYSNDVRYPNVLNINHGDWVGVAVDFVNNKVWVRNLTAGLHQWNNDGSQDPAANLGGFSISNLAGKRVVPGAAFFAPVGGTAKFNFGTPGLPPGPFVGVVPSGFTAGWRKPLGSMYDVFASDDGAGGVTLELFVVPSPGSGIGTDVDTGFKIKAGDPNKRLIGRCGSILSSNETGFAYPGTTTMKSMVCSFFQPRRRELGIFYTQGSILAEYTNGPTYQSNSNGPDQQLDWVGFTRWDGITDRLPSPVTLNVFAFGGPASDMFVAIVRNNTFISNPAYVDKGRITGSGSCFIQHPSAQFDDLNIQQSVSAGFWAFGGVTIPFEALLSATILE